MNEQEFERAIKKKDEEINELQVKINQLERKLLAYENAHTPPSLSKKKRIPRISSGILGAPKGHPKYERENSEVDEVIKYKINTNCPFCNIEISPKEVLEIIEEEIPEMKKAKVTKHLIEWSHCPNCDRRIIAKNNAPANRFGPNLRSKITLLKHDDRLPLRKVEQTLLRDHGFEVTHVGIMKIIRAVSKKLEAPYYEIVKIVRSSDIVHIDETQYKVDGKTWWLWTFVCDDVTLFVIRKSRSKKVVEEILGKDYNGVIVCDGWKVYENFSSNLQRCWSHLLRESFHLKEKYHDFEKYHDGLKDIFDDIVKIRLEPPGKDQRLILINQKKGEIRELIRRIKYKDNFKKFATTIENGIDYWFTCLEYLDVEPTNNYAEQALRELVVQRKIMGGLRSERGAETLVCASILLSLTIN